MRYKEVTWVLVAKLEYCCRSLKVIWVLSKAKFQAFNLCATTGFKALSVVLNKF